MWKYLNRKPVVGDVVEYQHNHPTIKELFEGALFIVDKVASDDTILVSHPRLFRILLFTNRLKVVATSTASHARKGDTIISLIDVGPRRSVGSIHEVLHSTDGRSARYISSEGNGASTNELDSFRLLIEDRDCDTATNDTLPQPSQHIKEPTMDIQQLLESIFGSVKPTTDYDKRPPVLVVAYNRDGSQMGTATAPSLQAVKDKIADTPELWGCKVLTYRIDKEVSVKVPVKEIDATSPEDKPTKD